MPSYPDWKGEYFDNDHFGGQPVLVRNDRAIDFDWGTGAPGPGVPPNAFTALGTGQLQVSEATAYRVRTTADDGVRVLVNERLIVDAWTQPDEAKGLVIAASRSPVTATVAGDPPPVQSQPAGMA